MEHTLKIRDIDTGREHNVKIEEADGCYAVRIDWVGNFAVTLDAEAARELAAALAKVADFG